MMNHCQTGPMAIFKETNCTEPPAGADGIECDLHLNLPVQDVPFH